jgi:hypothetical protein
MTRTYGESKRLFSLVAFLALAAALVGAALGIARAQVFPDYICTSNYNACPTSCSEQVDSAYCWELPMAECAVHQESCGHRYNPYTMMWDIPCMNFYVCD